MAKFNDEQLAAIHASSKRDILITAGAGSGKTNTLAERVFNLIEKKEIEPESLLVLTFTNNASYEMKTRILDRFGEGHPLYARMQSCHVQSFDSFRAYLVRANSQALNVPKTFSVLPSSIEEEKRTSIANEVVQDCLVDAEKKGKLVRFLTKFGFHDEKKVVESVLYLSKRLLAISPKQRGEFFASYPTMFFSKNGLRKLFDEQIELAKKELRDLLCKARFLDRRYDDIAADNENGDIDSLLRDFSSPSDWSDESLDVEVGVTENPEWDFLPDFYHDLCSLLNLPTDQFASDASTFVARHERAYGGVGKKGKFGKTEQDRLKAVQKTLQDSREVFEKITALGTFEEAREKALWCKDEELFLLDLTKEVISRLDAYKRSVNAFSFADIGFMAMSLFEESRFKKQADEIVGRFDYIMIDEYQDDDDAQENLLAALTRLRSDGTRAHLFCVGDAKQSIYAFRGANLNHFKERAKQYREEGLGDVIAMNKNYRSAKRVLSDINYIFSSYMTPGRGGIDYLDEMERLCYDDGANLYDVDTGNYGFRRIVPPNAFHLQSKNLSLEPEYLPAYEAMAILDDIRRKVKEGHLIYAPKAKEEKGEKKLRPCEYGDFAILVRKKRQFAFYQRLFLANGIPLNNHIAVDLREVSPIILIRSILGIMANRLYDTRNDEAHLFASIARSYAFRYDDGKLHTLLTEERKDKDGVTYLAFQDDAIMKTIDSFVEAHSSDVPMEKVFLDLIETFHVITALPCLGEVEAHVNKIESLFAMALAERDLGQGLKGFIALLDSIEDFDIKLQSETVSETKGAVDLMTIHASKGLERKIVYMPSSDSGIGKEDARRNPPFSFSLDHGICFPYLGYEIPEDVTPFSSIGGPISTIRTLAYKDDSKDVETHEHVRILYVALTRAENAFYLVGKDEDSCGYVMMNDLPKRVIINHELLEKARRDSTLDENAYKAFQKIENTLFETNFPLAPSDMGERYELGKTLFDKYVIDPLRKKRDETLTYSLSSLYEHYRKKLLQKADDLDLLARIYAGIFYPSRARDNGVTDFKSLISKVNEAMPNGGEGENEDKWRKRLNDFAEGIRNESLILLCPSYPWPKNLLEATPKGADTVAWPVRKVFVDALLPALAFEFDKIPYIAYESYRAEGFEDDTRIFDQRDFVGNTKMDAPDLPVANQGGYTVNDDPIAFAPVEQRRASKKPIDPDFVDEIALERGSHLHRLLQLSKLDEDNLDFIADPAEKDVVLRCLMLPLLQEAKRGKAYPEYGYYDTDFDTTGFIDLLFFDTAGVCHIVDYKTTHIDDPEYVAQLHVYRRNAARIFKIKESDIRMHLLSITKAEVKDVA